MQKKGFFWAAWANVAYLILVILFGAWVRITGSGAGCGTHWPTCHGEIIPQDPGIKTIIEFTHRVTSGMCGIIVLVLLVWALLKYGRKHRVFFGVCVTTFFIVLESLLGAGLVLKELVESDASAARAIVVSLHLVNTMALTAAASLTAWWSGGGGSAIWSSIKGPLRWVLLGSLGALVLTCMAGAVTALGDTIFPTQPELGPGVLDKISDDLSAANHFLVRLRIIHPILALSAATGIVYGVGYVKKHAPSTEAVRWANVLLGSLCAQVLVGFANIGLGAPGWIQLVHLFVTQIIWISALLMTWSSFAAAHQNPNLPPAS